MAGLLKKLRGIMLGADEYDEVEAYEGEGVEFDEAPEEKPARSTREPVRREVTEINEVRSRKTGESNVVNFQTGSKMQVVITYPNVVSDASVVCNYIREDKTCVVNLEGVDRANAQRIADFLGGAAYALNGELQRISNEIFIIAPANVHLTGEIKEELKAGANIFPWVSTAFK